MIFNKKVILLLLTSNLLVASISGVVFKDLPTNQQTLNSYGIREINEPGVEGIKVTAYPENLSTFTDENGTWSLNTTQNSRVEFSNIPDYLQESPSSLTNNSSVQFITNNTTNHTFGLYNPDDYTNSTNPSYATSIKISGQPVGITLQGIHTISYSANGLNANYSNYLGQAGTGERPQDEITMSQIGSVWGKAYQKDKNRLFVASMLQRHLGFAKTPAEIYIINYINGVAKNLEGSFSLQGIQPNNGGVAIDLGSITRVGGDDYLLEANPLLPNRDLDAYAKVGKISYGGIDIEYSKNRLWLMNLKQKALISIDISGSLSTLNGSMVNQYHLKDIPNTPTCSGGEIRPWAIKIYQNRGYVGLICDASLSQSTSDLHAYILSFSTDRPELGFKTEIDFPLDYPRAWKNWEAWRDTFFEPTDPPVLAGKFFPQPILSDIEFDEKSNMYIAFLDRYALQLSYTHLKAYSGSTQIENVESFGELLKVCRSNNTYELEGSGSCTQSNYSDLNISEFFNDLGGDGNKESSLGALAILKGSNQLLHTTLDPHPETINIRGEEPYWYTMGTQTLNLTNGKIDNWYANIYTVQNGLGYKGNRLGDIEIITSPAPTEIGNRVWFDANGNGVQDADEQGIENVQIDLICNGVVQATALSDSQGNYIFSNDPTNTLNSTKSHRYNISGLIENSNNCYLSIPNISGANQQLSLSNYTLTTPHIGEGNNSTLNDSDAEVNGTDGQILIKATDIPMKGSNNHSFDIGFKLISNLSPSLPTTLSTINQNTNNLTLGNRIWIDSNQNGIQDSSEVGYGGITISLYNNSDCSGVAIRTTNTDNNGLYSFTNLAPSTYCISIANLPVNYQLSLANQGGDDTVDSDANSNGEIQNIQLLSDSLNEDIGIYLSSSTIQITTNQNLNNVPLSTQENNTFNSYDENSSINPPLSNHSSTEENITSNSSDENNSSIYPTPTVLGVVECQEMNIQDDIQNANPTNATTTIDVLNNDIGTKSGQKIKFLSISEGKRLWENREENITSVTTFNTLTIEGEGRWNIINNKVVFTAFPQFNGKIPSSIYYIIEGEDCTDRTKYSNVGKITINTACTCPAYTTKSIDSLNRLTLFILVLLTLSLATFFLKREALQSF